MALLNTYRLRRLMRNLFAAVLATLLMIYAVMPLFIYGGVRFPLSAGRRGDDEAMTDDGAADSTPPADPVHSTRPKSSSIASFSKIEI